MGSTTANSVAVAPRRDRFFDERFRDFIFLSVCSFALLIDVDLVNKVHGEPSKQLGECVLQVVFVKCGEVRATRIGRYGL